MRGKKTRFCYEVSYIDKLKNIYKVEKFVTLNDIGKELDISKPTVITIMRGKSKKLCKHYKIKKI